MADDQPMWGNNRAVAPTLAAVIVPIELGDNFIVKGHHLSMIKDRQFDGRARADPHKHIAEFVKICGFTQYPYESLVEAWLRIKDLLHSCHGNGLARGNIIQIFYHRLEEATPVILDVGGIFLYKTPNEAYQLLEDRVLLKLDWSKDIIAKPLRKNVAFVEGSDNSKLMEKMEVLITKIDLQFKDIK
ncbi:hypothetical protein Tco_0138433 [Tanacetum coccineum]